MKHEQKANGACAEVEEMGVPVLKEHTWRYTIDLHVHSRFSTRPSQWILQKLGCAESYTSPKDIYAIAKARGMDYVTITDHNTINGSLEIADLPNTFVSEEVTTYFPEDNCKIHILAWDITEKQHADFGRLRENIYDLMGYLLENNIAHACAHALVDMNGKLTLQHVEKLFLLFKVFELNGARHPMQNSALRAMIDQLSPQRIHELEEKHKFAALPSEPWNKYFITGSDDHSSCHIGRSSTSIIVPRKMPEAWELMRAVMRGDTQVNSIDCTPATFAHNLYAIGYQFYKKHTGIAEYLNSSLLLQFVENMLVGLPTTRRKTAKNLLLSLADVVLRFGRGKKYDMLDVRENLQESVERIIRENPELRAIADDMGRIRPLEELPRIEKVFLDLIAGATESVQKTCADSVLKDLLKGNFFNVFKVIGATSSLYMLLIPYGVSYSLFARDAKFAEDCLAESFGQKPDAELYLANFTDTFDDVNGVAKSLQQLLPLAEAHNSKLQVLTCMPDSVAKKYQGTGTPVNFTPVGSFELPEYPELNLHYPPVLRIIQYCFEQRYTLLHAATPGPMGLVALLAARMLKLPIHATYHTAFPQYMRQLTNDSTLEEGMWRYVLWYYSQMDAIFVPSEATAQDLIARGLPRERIHLYPRGINAKLFAPAWEGKCRTKKPACMRGINFLYVGRMSKEKGLFLLVDAFSRVSDALPEARLTLVGDGPILDDLRLKAAQLPVHFTGCLHGDDLLAAYEQADIFVFPSTTDTFGNVVLEAQASGLPVIVSRQGGPRENILEGRTGLIVREENAEAYAESMMELARDPVRLHAMQCEARAYAQSRSLEQAFTAQWQLYQEWHSAYKAAS